MSPAIAARANADLIEQKYAEWKDDPAAVGEDWASFFEGFELGLVQPPARDRNGGAPAGAGDAAVSAPSPGREVVGGLDMATRAQLVNLVYNYRSLGHTKAWVDPIGPRPAPEMFTLDGHGFLKDHLEEEITTQFYEGGRRMKLRELIDRLERTYCGKVGYEYMHIFTPEVRHWIRERIETRIDRPGYPVEVKRKALTWLAHAELFEQFLHKKYVGQKRFSLEGGDSLMVALNGILEACPQQGVEEIVMGMAHRGRLNTLANFLHKPLAVILYEFAENYVPNLVEGDGDVKYHLGFDALREVGEDDEVGIHLGANPSHLEAVNAVIEGKARAMQRLASPNLRDNLISRKTILPILIHGDAAFSGQGSVAETLNLSQLNGYRTGGTVHIVVNNQVGFTTTPEDARSSKYCTDVGKMIEAPVFHVNGDSPMDVLHVAELALAFRQEFRRDVIIDIVCYRRYGHNEGDEPSFTLPDTYREIRSHETPLTLFRRELAEEGSVSAEEIDAIVQEYQDRLDREYTELKEAEENGDSHSFAGTGIEPQPPYTHDPVPTGVPRDTLETIGRKISTIPEHIKVNDKLEKRFLGARLKAIENGDPVNWAFAEALSFGSLILDKQSIRLSGQDCRRGTFSQRHAVLYNPETRERHTPLNRLVENQIHKLWVYNSNLSEFAVLGFEYGYSLVDRDTLVAWEAQFGDFANGAQVIIDQFIASAESKWGRSCNIVLLLPHGYEGQGPEHSSARLERFLQLCAEDNMQVCNLSTPAQYFHALRRQMKREVRKPLVLMTPKSLLTHPRCVSPLDDMAEGTAFREIIDDATDSRGDADRIDRIIFCSGKVYYDLLAFREEREIQNVAIVRIEQLYPLHYEELARIAAGYPNASKWVWCQEEPLNMGAWSFIRPRLEKLTDRHLRYSGRDPAASTATGAKAIHKMEQRRLIETAFHV